MSKETFFEKLFKDGVLALISETIKYLATLGLPFVMAGLTLASQRLNPEVPWTYVIVATVLVFASTAVGLLRFDEWSERRTPRNKLEIAPWAFNWVYTAKDEKNKPTGINAAQITMNFKNNANFPLSVVVEQFDASLDGNINPEKSHRGEPFVIQANGPGFFRDEQIPMRDIPCRKLEGKLKYRIRYGTPGREKYLLENAVKLIALYNSDTDTYKLHVLNDSQKQGFGT